MPRASLTNNATTTLASGITNVATSLTVASGAGARFPSSGYFYATIVDANNIPEIVLVTSRAADVFTITRAQDGTAARAFSAGAKVSLNLVAAVINELAEKGVNADITQLTGLTTPLSVPQGGTGGTSYTSGALVRGNGTGALTAASAADIAAALGSTAVTNATNATNATNVTGSGTISDNATINTQKVGYRDIPFNSVSAAYNFALGDEGETIFHPAADTTARTWTIPANASVAFRIGTCITLVNENGAGAITVAITTDTLYQPGTGATGSRTLASGGMCTLLKVTPTKWYISGAGLT